MRSISSIGRSCVTKKCGDMPGRGEKTRWQSLMSLSIVATCILLMLFVQSGWADNEKIHVLPSGEQMGHYLEWNGKPILLIGDSVTQGWMELGTNFDQKGYIDALASRGINLLMIWSFIGTSAEKQISDSRIGYDAPEIWPWQGSPDEVNFDLTRFNQAYFDRLKAFVEYANVKGIVVLITVHDGGVKWRFANHPFNSALGNGPLTDGAKYVELADYSTEMPLSYSASWSWQQKNQYFQERFCDKLISELNPFPNVIYEMFNEGEWYNSSFRNQHEQHFLAFFRARCSNLLLTNTDHIPGDNPHSDAKVDVITVHGGWTGRFGEFQNDFNNTPAKPYLLSEPVPEWNGSNLGFETIRRSAWEAALGGVGWVNQDDVSFGWDPDAAMSSLSTSRNQAYTFAGLCSQFINSLGAGLANMRPLGSLSSTGICMAQPGKEYIVYAPSGGTLTVDLSGAAGMLSAGWYNPRTGQRTSSNSMEGGGIVTFTSPDNNDWVLHIFQEDTPPDAQVPKSPTNLTILDQ